MLYPYHRLHFGLSSAPLSWILTGNRDGKGQIPPDLVVKLQVADIIDIILQLIRSPNGVYRACRKRKSRGALLSTSAVQLTTTKCDGVWYILGLEGVLP